MKNHSKNYVTRKVVTMIYLQDLYSVRTLKPPRFHSYDSNPKFFGIPVSKLSLIRNSSIHSQPLALQGTSLKICCCEFIAKDLCGFKEKFKSWVLSKEHKLCL